MKKTYRGSCHCGAVRYSAVLDLSEGVRRCNCSYCLKTRYAKAFTGDEAVTVLAGEAMLADYRGPNSQWPEDHIHHRFCMRCGVQVFSRGYLEDFGGWFYAVNVATLDDAGDEELAAAPIIYENGREDRYEEAPAVTAYL